jgi:hypothetical protein
VVLSAVKVLMKFTEMLSKDLDYYGTLLKKLAPPLVTLLSAEPELQYVALRNINLIVQKRYRDHGAGELACHTQEVECLTPGSQPGVFAPLGPGVKVRTHFGLLLLASSGKKPGPLLSVLQCWTAHSNEPPGSKCQPCQA